MRNTTINRFKGRTVAVNNRCCRTTGKEIREKVTERRLDTERGKFGNQSFLPHSIESFRYVQRDSKKLIENPNCEEPRIREKGKKITCRSFLAKALLGIGNKIGRNKMFPNLSVEDRFKNFRENGG